MCTKYTIAVMMLVILIIFTFETLGVFPNSTLPYYQKVKNTPEEVCPHADLLFLGLECFGKNFSLSKKSFHKP